MTWYKYRWFAPKAPVIAGKALVERRYWPMQVSDTVKYFYSPKPHDSEENDAFFRKYAPSGHEVISNFVGPWGKDTIRQQYRAYARVDQLPGILVLFKAPNEAQACETAWDRTVLLRRKLSGQKIQVVRDMFVDENGDEYGAD